MKEQELKQVILVRQDLQLPKGKLAVQVAHAAVDAVLKSNKRDVDVWIHEGAKKVVIKVENLGELRKYVAMAKQNGLITAVISDAGLTVLEPGTTTCAAIGPAEEAKIDEITGKLKIL